MADALVDRALGARILYASSAEAMNATTVTAVHMSPRRGGGGDPLGLGREVLTIVLAACERS